MSLGKRIGRYPVIREIGQGAVGTVYEGFDPATGSKVAIKVLRAEHLPDHRADSAASRFEREAQATRRLHHPNIVAVHEYGEQGRIKFIAMEYLHGQELRTLMRQRGRFGLDDAVTVTLQVLDALGHSHRHGVVHRDIKPTNVMVLEGLHVKVMDFGIARIESAAFTQMGTLLGTPAYMSPEQLRGLPADGRADLWAAGVMLHEMLVGRNPFAGATALEVTRNALMTEPAAVSSLVPGLPESLDAVLQRALAKERDQRFGEAAEFAAELVKAVAVAADAVDLELASAAMAVDLDLAAGPPAGAADADEPRPAP